MATNRQLTGVCVPALDAAYSSLAHNVSCVNLSWTDKDYSFRSCSSAISDMYLSISRGSLTGSGSDGTPSNSEIQGRIQTFATFALANVRFPHVFL